MPKYVISLSEQDAVELKVIVMDKDFKVAFKFLKDKVLSQVLKKEKCKMDVNGRKTTL